ncbi:MAG: FAD-dependent oxidoreductase [Spirochaetota bacterium]|nr:FAD-dependent oxidoreductase [Spirochaetota bacterium]
MPHVVAGLATVESIINPDKIFFQERGIKSLINKVTALDTRKKVLTLQNGDSLSYDKLLIATGAKPKVPPFPGRDLEGVYTLRSTPEAEKMKIFIEERSVKKMIIVGAGAIGLELGTLLLTTRPSLDITVVEFLDRPLPPMLDSELALTLMEYLTQEGIRLKLGNRVERIIGKDGFVSGVELSTGEIIPADMVVLSIGVQANLELAKQIGLELGDIGIKVNKFMETSNPDIFAAGDCVQMESPITKKPIPGQNRSTAVIQGRLVAKQLAGYNIEFPGVLNNLAVKLFDKSIASVGLIEEFANKEGIKTVSSVVESRNKHKMIKGQIPWTLKLVFDKNSQKLIGGQILSDSEAPMKEIDTINYAIRSEATVSDLTTIMCAAHPDLSSEPSAEPIALAAEQSLQKFKAI